MDRDILQHAIRVIQRWLVERYEMADVPGFVVGIAQDGAMLMNEAYGFADVERAIPMRPNHIFRIASHSKTFTATAIMLLAEEGQLRIDDQAEQYVPWLKGHKDPRYANVTLRQLLSHGAGVIRDGLDINYWQMQRPFPDADQFISEMKATGLVLENNTKMKYTNYGYTLLGMVIEAVTGQSYNEFLLDRIIRPLGLDHTFPEFCPELGQPPAEELVTGYARRDPKTRLPIDAVSTHVMSPATGFCSTAADLCSYFTAQMVGSGQLLRDESKKEMQRAAWPTVTPGQPRNAEYGLGFTLRRYEERQTFGHSGGIPGCITNTMADPKDRIVVTALTNAADGPAAEMIAGVYRILNYFEQHAATAQTQDWSALEGIYANMFGILHVVAAAEGLVTLYGEGWDPLVMVEKLAWVEAQTFKIFETNSSGSEGESVHFHTVDGRVDHVTYAGATMWPQAVWRQHVAARTRYSL